MNVIISLRRLTNNGSGLVTLLLLMTVTTLFITSCSKTTENKTGSLTGSVVLQNDTGNSTNDAVDNAGVTIALYKAVVLDTAMVRINEQYPSLGIPINQKTEFDHRLQTPVATVYTNAEGSFQIKNIHKGSYNLAIYKDGWGIRYLYNLDIRSGSNTLSQALKAQDVKSNTEFSRDTVELYPVRTLNGYVLNSYTFQTNHSYLVTNNVSFVENVIIQPSAYIWLMPNMRITVSAYLSQDYAEGEFCRITSADKMYSTTKVEPSEIQVCDGIYCNADLSIQGNLLQNLYISYASLGLSLQVTGLHVQNVVFNNCRIGIQFLQSSEIVVSNCNIQKSNDPDIGGISLIDCSNTTVEKNIFHSNTTGLRQHTTVNAAVKNNYFCRNSEVDIYNLYETTGTVEHCEFMGSYIAIETSGQSNTAITYCNIQGRTGILNTQQLNWTSSEFLANNNNFNCSVFAIQTKARYWSGDLVHYNGKNNFWTKTTSTEIADNIWDRNDESTDDPIYYQYKGIVDYSPYKTIKVQTAGIL